MLTLPSTQPNLVCFPGQNAPYLINLSDDSVLSFTYPLITAMQIPINCCVFAYNESGYAALLPNINRTFVPKKFQTNSTYISCLIMGWGSVLYNFTHGTSQIVYWWNFYTPPANYKTLLRNPNTAAEYNMSRATYARHFMINVWGMVLSDRGYFAQIPGLIEIAQTGYGNMLAYDAGKFKVAGAFDDEIESTPRIVAPAEPSPTHPRPSPMYPIHVAPIQIRPSLAPKVISHFPPKSVTHLPQPEPILMKDKTVLAPEPLIPKVRTHASMPVNDAKFLATMHAESEKLTNEMTNEMLSDPQTPYVQVSTSYRPVKIKSDSEMMMWLIILVIVAIVGFGIFEYSSVGSSNASPLYT